MPERVNILANVGNNSTEWRAVPLKYGDGSKDGPRIRSKFYICRINGRDESNK